MNNYSVSFVVAGYTVSVEEFPYMIQYNPALQDFQTVEQKFNINNPDNTQISEEVIEKIKQSFPVKNYSSDSLDCKITHSTVDNKLIFEINNFSKNTERIEKIINAFIAFLINKDKDIFAIGFNISENCLLDRKLKILNNEIETLKDWNTNTSFQVVLPFQNDNNITATYKIQKISEKFVDDKKIREYKISVNFNKFLEGSKKITLIKEFLNTCFDKFIQDFEYNKRQILEIGQNNDK